MKLNRDRIHQKKPKDSIKEKTPNETHIPTVIGKIPQDTGESFSLPPRKPLHNGQIPKSEVKAPSNYGSQKKRSKDLSSTNTPPPREDRSFKDMKSKRPADHGKIIQKSKVQSHALRKFQERKQKPPSRKGLDSSKKSRRSINRPLSRQIQAKTPRKTTIRSPPATSQLEKKKTDRKSNQSPPSLISLKTPEQKRPLPPPTVRDKIPKTKIKEKKPK
ncbi:MAG: hypothetical protein ACTSSO_02220 [Candidatus Hodarchaeales archaeon]